MSRFASQFLGPMMNGNQQHSGPQLSKPVLALKPSKKEPENLEVRPFGSPEDARPLLFSKTSTSKKPHVLVTRGGGTIATAVCHSFSSKIDLTLYGKPIPMKLHSISGNYTVDSPSLGKLKWKLNQFTGRSMELVTASGKTLATVKGEGFPGSGRRKIEILVPSDDYTIDLILASALVVRYMTVQLVKAGAEGAGAAGGAV